MDEHLGDGPNQRERFNIAILLGSHGLARRNGKPVPLIEHLNDLFPRDPAPRVEQTDRELATPLRERLTPRSVMKGHRIRYGSVAIKEIGVKLAVWNLQLRLPQAIRHVFLVLPKVSEDVSRTYIRRTHPWTRQMIAPRRRLTSRPPAPSGMAAPWPPYSSRSRTAPFFRAEVTSAAATSSPEHDTKTRNWSRARRRTMTLYQLTISIHVV